MSQRRARKRRRYSLPTKPDLVARLVQKKPSTLRKRLNEIEKFIVEFKATYDAWTNEKSAVCREVDEGYSAVSNVWQEVTADIAASLASGTSLLITFAKELESRRYATWSSWFSWLTGEQGGVRVPNVVALFRVHDRFENGIVMREVTDEQIAVMCSVGNYGKCCSVDELTTISNRVEEVLTQSRDRAIVALDCVGRMVDSSPIGCGVHSESWRDWRIAMGVWAKQIPMDLVHDEFKDRCTRLFGESTAWMQFKWKLPPKKELPTRKLYGRPIDKNGLDLAQQEREAIVIALSRLETEASELRTKHGFSDKTIAAAAAFFDQTRKLADQLRKEMWIEFESAPICPYCDKAIDGAPHLDHIHPQSHGGLSKRDNLVFACSTCNGDKSDLTLLEYAEKMSLEFQTIVIRLRARGKRV